MKITENRNEKYQRFEGIGASGAWWAQLAGDWDNIDEQSGMQVRDRIAQLLYSKTEGIGMHTYRYNIGAGSAESGSGSIPDPSRRTHGLEKAPFDYDFENDAAAIYMMKRAVQEGAEEVILFVNSPPERMTKNGLSHLEKSHIGRTNLAKKDYPQFARFCLDVASHFVSEGIPVKYISPVNEPLWVWNGGQEGCHYSPSQAGKVMLECAKQMAERPELRGVKLSGVENGDVRWFNNSYTRALMKYPEVRALIDGVDYHAYFLHPTPAPFDRVSILKRWNKTLTKKYPGMNAKMSEWCHMQGGRHRGMDSALVMANTMYDDIAVMNAVSWSHWIACSNVDFCDGLIYIYPETKTFETTKRLYGTGNFSKYIPFGAVRFEASADNENVKVLAFEKDGKSVYVLINNGKSSERITADADCAVAVTDKDNDLKETGIAKGNEIVIPAESIVTIVK